MASSKPLNRSYELYIDCLFIMCDCNLFSLFLCLPFPQVNVGEGYWGTHCTAQIVGRNRNRRDVTGLDPLLSRWPPFPPRPVCLCEGGWEEGGGCGKVNWGYTYTSRIKRLTKSNTLKSDFRQQHRRDPRWARTKIGAGSDLPFLD